MTTVITGVSPRLESDVAERLEAAPGVTVVRRCADLAELLSTGAAGIAEVALLSPDLRGLDRDAVRQLAGHGVRVAGVVGAHDDEGERRLRQLGVAVVLHPGDDALTVGQALTDLADGVGFADARPGGVGPADLDARGRLDPGLADDAGRWAEDLDADAFVGGDGPPRPARDEDRPGQVVCVWGPIGSPGRTTVAVSLAAELAAQGRRVLLVDLDTWGASIAQHLALVDEAPGVAAAARASEQGLLDLTTLARLSPEVVPGLRVLTGLPTPQRWSELRVAAVENVLDVARLLAEVVVVDCGFCLEDDEELSYDTAAPRRNATTLTALEGADLTLAVGAGDPVGLQRLVRGVQELATRPGPSPVVVVNKVRVSAAGAHPERSIGDLLRRFAGMEDLHFVPWAPAECDAALLAGRLLLEEHPDAAVTRALRSLADLLSTATHPSPTPVRGGPQPASTPAATRRSVLRR